KPQDVDTLVNLGAARRRAGDVAKATQDFRLAIRLAPGDAQAHYNLGVCLSDAGKIDEAVQEIRRAVGIDAKYALAWRRLGAIELKRGKCGEARAAFGEFFKLAPKQPRKEADELVAKCKPRP